jgi:hypothetical protein
MHRSDLLAWPARAGLTAVAFVVTVVLSAGPAFAATWTIQATSNPNGATYSDLNGVSCASSSACVAAGYSDRANGSDRTLIERWNGTKWAIQTSPNPKHTQGAILNGVSCPTGKACIAVGRNDRPNGLRASLAIRWNGSKWSLQTTPNAARPVTVLNGVTCLSATSCVAVGQAGSTQISPDLTVVESWDGSKWTLVPSPNPQSEQLATLQSVSCSSASACTAAGYWQEVGGRGQLLLVERWNGSKWKIQDAPDPSGGTGAAFGGVSCSSDTECTATGYYVNGTTAASLVERWDGTNWKVQSSPNPQSAMATLLDAVSCPSSTSCTATGLYQTNAGQLPVAERWDGSTWKLEAPAPPNGSLHSSLDGVSCTGAKTCESVGASEDVNGNGFTLAEASG